MIIPPLPRPPNQISLKTRLVFSGISLVVLAYGSYGLWVDDLYIPGKRGRGIHFHGTDALLMFGALCCIAARLLSVVVDHFDRRNNERSYKRFAVVTEYGSYGLFVAAIVVRIFHGV